MTIYLINKETNETVQTFENVTNWGVNFVCYINGGYPGKTYCEEDKYFTDIDPNAPEEVDIIEETEDETIEVSEELVEDLEDIIEVSELEEIIEEET